MLNKEEYLSLLMSAMTPYSLVRLDQLLHEQIIPWSKRQSYKQFKKMVGLFNDTDTKTVLKS